MTITNFLGDYQTYLAKHTLGQTKHIDRRQAVDNAIASQRLEGLEPDAEVMQQLAAFAEGRLGIEAILEGFRGRIVDGQLLPAVGRK